MLVVTIPRDEPGEPLGIGVYGIVAPIGEELISPQPGNALPESTLVELGLFYADDASPGEIAKLRRECSTVSLPEPIPRREFMDRFHAVCWQYRGALVAFHIPQEIGRLAVSWSRAAKNPGRGGFSQILWTKPGRATRKHPTLANGEIEDQHRPRIVSKAIDAHRGDVRFKPVRGESYWPGVFTSLQALAEALSGSRIASLAEACEKFETPAPSQRDGSIRSLVSEIRAMGALYRKLLTLHREISPEQPPMCFVSSGTYAQAMLRQMSIEPPLQRWSDFPREVLASAAGAYFAGDLFVEARTSGLPIMTLDFRGAYAASAVLAGAWDVLTAERVEVVEDDPAAVAEEILKVANRAREFIHGNGSPLSLEEWRFAAWTTVELEPGGALLPVRSRSGEAWAARRQPVRSRRGPLPYQVADVVSHCLDGGSIPPIKRAIRIRPRGCVTGKPFRLPTGRTILPESEDAILALISESARVERDSSLSAETANRLRGMLKGIGNALVSGLPIQVNDDEPTKKPRPEVVFDPRTGRASERLVPVRETPGLWYFPPIAVAVTSSARLLLHLAIATIREMGGVVAYWDTDSVFVVATASGGRIAFPGGPLSTADGRPAIRALSRAEVRQARQRIEELFPFSDVFGTYAYAPAERGLWRKVREPGLLRVEPENQLGILGFPTEVQLAARAPKRYVIAWIERPGQHVRIGDDGKPVVVDPTPEEMRQLTRVRVKRASEHGLPYLSPKGNPDWIAEGWEHQIRLHHGLPTEQPRWWGEPAIIVVPAALPAQANLHPQARPYCRLAVLQVPLLGPVVAPWHEGFVADAAQWHDLAGKPVRVAYPGASTIGETLGQAITRVWYSVDVKALDAEGLPANARTEGLVKAAPVIATEVRVVGKESRHLGAGREILSSPEYVEYGDEDSWSDFLECLKLVAHEPRARRNIAEDAGISIRWLEHILAGQGKPSLETRARLLTVVTAKAAKWIAEMHPSVVVSRSEMGVLNQYLELSPPPTRECHECGTLLEERKRDWCSERCRKRHERRPHEQLKLRL